MSKIEEAKLLLDEINAEDVAEDTAFQAQIDSLSTHNTELQTQLDTVTAERVALQARLDSEFAALREDRDALQILLNNLDTRIAALEA